MVRLTVVLALNLALASVGHAQTDAAAAARREYARGTTLEAQQNLDEAARAYEHAIQLDPRLAIAHDRLGFVHGLKGRPADAIAEFQRACAIDPALFDAQYHLGATLWWTGQYEQALDALKNAVNLQPNHAEARYYLGLSLKKRGALDR